MKQHVIAVVAFPDSFSRVFHDGEVFTKTITPSAVPVSFSTGLM